MNMIDECQHYELTLSPDYVSSWGLWEAVRELLQNAIDSGGNPVYEALDGCLTIGSVGTLDVRTLLLGQTTKRNDSSMIGQYGEGYKLALLVLVRLGYSVTIRNGMDRWVPSFQWSEKYGSMILCIDVTKGFYIDNSANDSFRLSYIITGIDSLDILTLSQKYLPDVPLNSIIDEGLGITTGSIYVAGLFVCTLDGLVYSYNFEPSRLQLGRDRHLATDFNITYEASRIHADKLSIGDSSVEDKAVKQLYDMLEADKPDTKYVGNFNYYGHQKIVDEYTKRHGDAIPVATQEDIARIPRGASYRLVPLGLRTLLWNIKEWLLPSKTPKQKLSELWNTMLKQIRLNDLENKLDIDGLSESFDNIFKEL